MTGVVSWVSTWAIMIGLLIIVAQTEWGRAIVYYLIWLAVILLIVTHADEVSSLVNLEALKLNG